MGACVSSDSGVLQLSKPANHNQPPPMDYTAPAAAAASKPPTNLLIPASPIGEKPSLIVTLPMPQDLAANYRLSSAKFRSFGSKEDVFFESQPWLESDGDDEFFSVNGDLTTSIASSASNTPKHRSLSAAASNPSEDTAAGYKLTLSPVKKRKSLSELFKEDEEEDHKNSNQDTSSSDDDTLKFNPSSGAPKSAASKPHFPQHTFTNINMDVKVKKDRSPKPAHQCFPKLFSVHGPRKWFPSRLCPLRKKHLNHC